MRILASGDHHFDEHRRFDECVRVHAWMVDVARRENVDLFLSGGDIYERASTPIERREVAAWLTAMTEICPVVIAKGNHERPLDCALLGRLRTKHPIIVEEAAGVHFVAGAAVAAIAWPDRTILAGRSASQNEADESARAAFRSLLLGLREQLVARGNIPRIGVGHFMIDGSVVSTGQPLLGMPLNLGLSDLALLEASLVVCSHIHKAQEWTFGGSRILYPGSPYRTDFGQRETKSVTLAEYRAHELASVIQIETPATRMVHLEDEWGTSDFDGVTGWLVGDGDPAEFRGAEIRFRYRVPVDQQDAAKAAAAKVERELREEYGAASVKIEPAVIPLTRSRAPEIAAAPTLPDKLRALWRTRDEEIAPERETRLFSKLAILEEEARSAA